MSIADKPASSSSARPVSLPELESFSLVLGGPLYQLLRKARLEDRVEDRLLDRVVIFSGLLWLPLLFLCLAEGTLVGGVAVPFLRDIETHVRFLFVVPLFIVAELIVHQRIRAIVAQFIERGLIPDDALERFRGAVVSAMNLRNSVVAEVLLIVIVFPLGHYLRADLLAPESTTWYAHIGDGGVTITKAGLWLRWVSSPVMQFLLLRWYFRIFIWARFLWQVSRIDLVLIPTHPDRNGGLGFLGASAYAQSPLLTAHGAALAGYAASRIFYENASLPDFKLEIVALVAILMLVVLGPLAVFAPRILAAKRNGLREYGLFAAQYMRDFDRHWLLGKSAGGESALGSADIQSLADLDASFSIIKEITPFPFSRTSCVQLVVATVVPFMPLLLTMFPFEELLDRIIGAVF